MISTVSDITLRVRSTLICSIAAVFVSGSGYCAADAAIHWGVVGHTDHGIMEHDYPYNKVSLQEQMHLITSSGMSWYRTSCNSANCNQLITAASASGVQILKSIEMMPDSTLDEQQNYQRAYAAAAVQGSSYGEAFKYFEAGDELDVWVRPTGDGSERSQYPVSRYLQARGFVRGVIDGIHSVDASAKVVVADAGWCHYGFLQMLWQDGVRWNLTGVHWYDNEGNIEHAGCNGANVAAIHAAFGLPTWITEFNSNTAVRNDDSAAEGVWMAGFISQIQSIASKYDIEAAFAYELLDESNLTGPNGHYGVFYADGSPKFSIAPMINKAVDVPLPPGSIRIN